jgi:hypothetical protein
MTQARRKQEEGKSISPDPARDSSAEHLEEVNRAFRKLMGLLARPVGGDLFQRGIEAVSMVLRAGYGGVVLCAEGGQLKESVFTRLTPWGKRDVRRFIVASVQEQLHREREPVGVLRTNDTRSEESR